MHYYDYLLSDDIIKKYMNRYSLKINLWYTLVYLEIMK